MTDEIRRTHHYHAEAKPIEGHLRLPVTHQIRPKAHTCLPEDGGYHSQRTENFKVEEVISIRSAHTHVSGNRSNKPGEGWNTLTTVVVEGLNVLEVLTADRIVGQIITHHPLQGYVPSISFLGTRFENLRIAGYPVNLDLDLGILGSKPANDAPYGRETAFKEGIAHQYHRIRESTSLPADTLERYNRLSSTLGASEEVECSLVNRAWGDYPGSSFGHLIHIPDFGWISLGNVKVTYKEVKEKDEIHRRTTVRLDMIDLHLGCAIEGKTTIGSGSSNGSSVP